MAELAGGIVICVGIPGQVRTTDGNQAKVDVYSIQYDVNLMLISSCDEDGQSCMGRQVLAHVGFVMSVIDEAEVRDTLDALQSVFDVGPGVGVLLCGGEK